MAFACSQEPQPKKEYQTPSVATLCPLDTNMLRTILMRPFPNFIVKKARRIACGGGVEVLLVRGVETTRWNILDDNNTFTAGTEIDTAGHHICTVHQNFSYYTYKAIKEHVIQSVPEDYVIPYGSLSMMFGYNPRADGYYTVAVSFKVNRGEYYSPFINRTYFVTADGHVSHWEQS
jgi:hypothetical protein